MKNKKGRLWVGTSNIVVPGNKQDYPKQYQHKSRLHYYSSFFNSLEINSSFYKIPMPATFEKWAADVPVNFQFTVKLWKEITHIKELNADPGHVDRFLNAANKLGIKKGCLLVQFPGKITLEHYGKVEKILEHITRYDPENKWRIAVEFRNASWYTGETFDLMDEYDASLVMHDIPKSRNERINKKASFVYKRFHGLAGDYRGSYSNEKLELHATEIKKFIDEGKDVYAYFNNTIGNAFKNALDLQSMLVQDPYQQGL